MALLLLSKVALHVDQGSGPSQNAPSQVPLLVCQGKGANFMGGGGLIIRIAQLLFTCPFNLLVKFIALLPLIHRLFKLKIFH